MSRRWRYPRSRRGRIYPPPPPSTAAPAFQDQAGPRPRFGVRVRRGSFFAVPRQLAAPPAISARRRTATLLLRRGKFQPVIPAPVITPPPWPPDTIGRSRRRLAAIRRGRFSGTPQTATSLIASTRTRVRQPTAPRHGRFAAVPQAPAPAPQPIAQNRPSAPTIRRGHFLLLPPPVPIIQPPIWIPPPIQGRRTRPGPVRHGRFTACPADASRPPGTIRRHPGSAPTVRRGHHFDPPWTTAPVGPPPRSPDRLGIYRRRITPARRGRFHQPPWPQAVPPIPPPTVPTYVRHPRRIVRPRRGCLWQWPVFQAIAPTPTTTRGRMDEHLRLGPGTAQLDRDAPDVIAVVAAGTEIAAERRTTADAVGTARPSPDINPAVRGGSDTSARSRTGSSMGGS